MTIFFVKSLLSLLLLVAAAISAYSMFEVFGRQTPAPAIERFKKMHKISGYSTVALFLLISYFCIGFMNAAKTEPSPRASLHVLLAYTVAGLFLAKVLFVRKYRLFYANAKVIGIMMIVIIVVIVGISGGNYLIVSGFGRDLSTDKSVYYSFERPFFTVKKTSGAVIAAVRTDRFSIDQGRIIFQSRCSACHDPISTRTIVGPGLKGILKNPTLPISGHPATAESIRFQLRQPLGRMPSFAYLTDEEVDDLIAYLNTL